MVAKRETKQGLKQALPRGIIGALAIAAVGLTQTAMAQSIHKYVWPDGRIIYSNEPVPGARRIGTVAAPPAPSRQSVEAAQRGAEADQRAQQQLLAQEIARQRVEDAMIELERARRALARSSGLQPGADVADGGAGLPEGYRYRLRPRGPSDSAR